MASRRAVTPRPYSGIRVCGCGPFVVSALASFLLISGFPLRASANDGASEALELRLHAERAIERERAMGHGPMAEAMRELLPGLLLEYLLSRDETVAMDVVDAAFIEQQFEVAELMEEPGLAWALDVFAGPGTGYEHQLRTAMADLADFHEERAQRASEAAVRAYEKQLDRHLDRLDQDQEVRTKVESHRLEAETGRVDRIRLPAETFVKPAERAEEKANRAVEKVVEKAADNAADKVEQAADKADNAAEQVADGSEKAADQAEKKADDKAEKPAADPPAKGPDGEKGGKK